MRTRCGGATIGWSGLGVGERDNAGLVQAKGEGPSHRTESRSAMKTARWHRWRPGISWRVCLSSLRCLCRTSVLSYDVCPLSDMRAQCEAIVKDGTWSGLVKRVHDPFVPVQIMVSRVRHNKNSTGYASVVDAASHLPRRLDSGPLFDSDINPG